MDPKGTIYVAEQEVINSQILVITNPQQTNTFVLWILLKLLQSLKINIPTRQNTHLVAFT